MSGLEVWSEVLQWVVLVVIGGMAVGLVYLVADLNRRLGPDRGSLVPEDGLKIESEAPALRAVDARTGAAVEVPDRQGRKVVVSFLSPTCRPCVDLVPHLNRLAQGRRGVRFVAVIGAGHGFDYAAGLAEPIQVVSDAAGEWQEAWRVERTPHVYTIDGQGKVVLRSIANDLLDLEDTLEGIGQPQGNLPWVAVAREGREDKG